jgi:hypothetical protein
VPSPRLDSDSGLLHVPCVTESRTQVNVLCPVAVNAIVAVVEVLMASGSPAPQLSEMGGDAFTFQVYAVAFETLPTASMALTRNVWLPALSPVYDFGEAHAVKDPAVDESIEHV